MYWSPICIVAGLLTLAAQAAEAAAPPRTMDLEILANGRLLLRGELIDSADALEARLRVLREREPPFELRLRLPKTFTLDIAAMLKTLESMGDRLGLLGNDRARPAPRDLDTI